MCGVAGFLGDAMEQVGDPQRVAEGMAAVLEHRGPDESGVWVDTGAGIALGHTRLSILDLSPQGRQPMSSGSGRYVIAYNGEVYNHRLLKAELEQHGQVFRGRSDTEVVLAAIDQ